MLGVRLRYSTTVSAAGVVRVLVFGFLPKISVHSVYVIPLRTEFNYQVTDGRDGVVTVVSLLSQFLNAVVSVAQ